MQTQIIQLRRAGEHDAPRIRILVRARHRRVIPIHHAIVHDQQRRPRIRDRERVLRIGLQAGIPDLEIAHADPPEPGRAVDVHARQAALELCRVDRAEGIRAGGIML